MSAPRGVELHEDELVVLDGVLEVLLREDEDVPLGLNLGPEAAQACQGQEKKRRLQKSHFDFSAKSFLRESCCVLEFSCLTVLRSRENGS